ncbi:MAG: hypothetical protein GOMPHAMPRED_002770 [Gomphillus americanus]|uniref:Uncharacterized protein n=1 Tax=Gomphillus americanus TaxID=1940652 RepID=A0A8H3FEQ3_9LECA|nr:MAG: hypothetical protein GOMPHAMPRED_002770 [Gomphillus americanus]
MEAGILHPNWNLGGVQQHLRSDGQDRQRACRYFHLAYPEIGDNLLTIYEKWGQDLTVQGRLTNCFRRHDGDTLEKESICKLATIASQAGSTAYDYLIDAFYQRLKSKENSAAGPPTRHRITPNEIEEIWAGLSLNSYQGMSQSPTRQPLMNCGPVHPRFDTFYNQALARQNLDLYQSQKTVYGNGIPLEFGQPIRPLPLISDRNYQPGSERVPWTNVNLDAIWSELHHEINKIRKETRETIEKNVNVAQAQLRTDIVAELKSSLGQEITSTLKRLLKQEVVQECQQEIEQKVNEAVQHERQSKIKKQTKEVLKHELKADLVDQIDQAVKREMLNHAQKELEASFKDDLFERLRGNIGQDVISRLLGQNNNPKTLDSKQQVPTEDDYTSRFRETSLQNKRVAPEAEMERGQFNKKPKVEKDEAHTSSKDPRLFRSGSNANKSSNEPSKDEKTWTLDRFESKNAIYETGRIKLILNTAKKILSLHRSDADSSISFELTPFFKNARVCHSQSWVTNRKNSDTHSIWLKVSNANAFTVADLARELCSLDPRTGMIFKQPIDACYSEWSKFRTNHLSSSNWGSSALQKKTWPIRSLHTSRETFTGKALQLALSQDSKSLSIHNKKIIHKLDTRIEQASSCRYSNKMVYLETSKDSCDATWIVTVEQSRSLVAELERVANIKAEALPAPAMNERFNSWKGGE